MTNETYHVLGASIRAAKMGLGNGIIILLKQQKRGKTHTVKILQRDNMPYVQRMPPGTAFAMYQFLIATNPSVYFIDDKDKWDRFIFTLGLRYLKGLSDGEKAPLKMTSYIKEQVTDPIPTHSWSWVLFNKPQFDSCNPILNEIGILARAILLRVGHTSSELKKIRSYYEDHGYNEIYHPTLKIHNDWYVNKPRTITADERRLIEEMPEDSQSNVFKLCKVMSETGFYAVLDCLQISRAGNYYMEEIEFIDPKGEYKL